MKMVSFVCPLCRQELALETFEEDFVPPRRLRVSVSRIPNHPLPLIAVCDARLAIHCPTSNQVVYERCDGEHVFEDVRPTDRQCQDPMCWTTRRHRTQQAKLREVILSGPIGETEAGEALEQCDQARAEREDAITRASVAEKEREDAITRASVAEKERDEALRQARIERGRADLHVAGYKERDAAISRAEAAERARAAAEKDRRRDLDTIARHEAFMREQEHGHRLARLGLLQIIEDANAEIVALRAKLVQWEVIAERDHGLPIDVINLRMRLHEAERERDDLHRRLGMDPPVEEMT